MNHGSIKVWRNGAGHKLIAMWLTTLIAITLTLELAGWAFASDNRTQRNIIIRILGSTQLSPDKGSVSIVFPDVAEGLLTSPQQALKSPRTRGSEASAPKVDSSTSLKWALNIPARHTAKITAELGMDHTPKVLCKATLAKPDGSSGTSTGQQTLGIGAVDMLTDIGTGRSSGSAITYEVSLLDAVTPPANELLTVIWTLTEVSDSGYN